MAHTTWQTRLAVSTKPMTPMVYQTQLEQYPRWFTASIKEANDVWQ